MKMEGYGPLTRMNIPQSTSNWKLYQRKVKEKNMGILEGDILLPDLDKKRGVGK